MRAHVISVTVLLSVLATDIALAGGPRTADDTRKRVFIVSKVKAPSDQALAAVFLSEVARFKETMTQLRFPLTSNGADYAYLEFSIRPTTWQGVMDIEVSSQFLAPPAHTITVPASCHSCGPTFMRRLFLELIQRTLFHYSRGIYRPLPIVRCEIVQSRATIDVTPVAGIGIEESVMYVVRFPDANGDSAVILVPLPGDREDSARATFLIYGPAIPASRFIRQCRSQSVRAILLVPRALPPGDPATTNANVLRASQ